MFLILAVVAVIAVVLTVETPWMWVAIPNLVAALISAVMLTNSGHDEIPDDRRPLYRRMRQICVATTVIGAVLIGIGLAGQDSNPTKPKVQPKAQERQQPNINQPPVTPKTSGPAPTQIVIKDIVKGTGLSAESGQTVTVRYKGTLYQNGQLFDSSWSRTPNYISFGLGDVIPCWQEGVPGMKIGGRRELICPADTAYGPQERPGIPANSTLVFVIDLLGAKN